MRTSTWKNSEKIIAKTLRGYWEHLHLAGFPTIDRVPITGRNRGSAPDIEHPLFSIEVKHRESLPQWLKDRFKAFQSVGRSFYWTRIGGSVYAGTLESMKNVSDLSTFFVGKPESSLDRQLPAEFREAFVQAAASAEGLPDKAGLVILHQKGMAYRDCPVFLILPEAMEEIRNEWRRDKNWIPSNPV